MRPAPAAIHSRTPCSPGARTSAEVTMPRSRRPRGSAAAASPPMNSGPPRCRWVTPRARPSRRRRARRWRWRRRRGTPGGCRPGGSEARSPMSGRRRGDEQRGVDPGPPEQREEHLADLVGADRAGAAHLGPELCERQRGAAGGAGRGDPDLLDELASLTLGDRLDRAHEHVEDVHAHRHDLHSSLRLHAAWCRRSRARSRRSTTAARASSSSSAGRRSRGLASRRCRPTRAATSDRWPPATSSAKVTAPWLAISAAVWPTSDSTTDVGELGRAERLVRRDRDGAAEQRASSSGRTAAHRPRRRARSPSAHACERRPRRRGARRYRGGGRARRLARTARRPARRRGRPRRRRPASSSASTAPGRRDRDEVVLAGGADVARGARSQGPRRPDDGSRSPPRCAPAPATPTERIARGQGPLAKMPGVTDEPGPRPQSPAGACSAPAPRRPPDRSRPASRGRCGAEAQADPQGGRRDRRRRLRRPDRRPRARAQGPLDDHPRGPRPRRRPRLRRRHRRRRGDRARRRRSPGRPRTTSSSSPQSSGSGSSTPTTPARTSTSPTASACGSATPRPPGSAPPDPAILPDLALVVTDLDEMSKEVPGRRAVDRRPGAASGTRRRSQQYIDENATTDAFKHARPGRDAARSSAPSRARSRCSSRSSTSPRRATSRTSAPSSATSTPATARRCTASRAARSGSADRLAKKLAAPGRPRVAGAADRPGQARGHGPLRPRQRQGQARDRRRAADPHRQDRLRARAARRPVELIDHFPQGTLTKAAVRLRQAVLARGRAHRAGALRQGADLGDVRRLAAGRRAWASSSASSAATRRAASPSSRSRRAARR